MSKEKYHIGNTKDFHFGYDCEMKNNLRTIRENRGLSQADLAKLVNTSEPQISRLETGERGLDQKWLIRLSGALKCTKAEILGESPYPIPLAHEPTTMIIDILIEELGDTKVSMNDISRICKRAKEANLLEEADIRGAAKFMLKEMGY